MDDIIERFRRLNPELYNRHSDEKSRSNSRERGKRYRRNHSDEEKARVTRYRLKHKNDEKYKLRIHIYGIKYGRSLRGLEKSRENGMKYRLRHPGREASRIALRKAIIKGTKSEKFTKQEIYDRDGGRCHLCGKKCDPRKWHLDHLIPLSLGGEHTRKNTAVACPGCNERKGNRGHSQLRLFG